MKTRSAVVGGGVTAAAAVMGNVFVGKEALSWFRGLRAPRWPLSMPGFLSVAAAYYVIMGVVLSRGVDRRDAGTIAWAVAVLAGNEAWNGLLFGRRSPRAAFVGLLVLLVPLGGLQRSVWRDERSRWILLPYTSYVIGYDVPWAYRLWRLNASRDS
jgi:tryptophan-rich sensory protein